MLLLSSFYRSETIVASILLLMVLSFKVIFNLTSKHQFVMLHFCTSVNVLTYINVLYITIYFWITCFIHSSPYIFYQDSNVAYLDYPRQGWFKNSFHKHMTQNRLFTNSSDIRHVDYHIWSMLYWNSIQETLRSVNNLWLDIVGITSNIQIISVFGLFWQFVGSVIAANSNFIKRYHEFLLPSRTKNIY